MKLPLTVLFLYLIFQLKATDYHVGPAQPLSTIAQVPWASLQAGDRVFIYWQATPYFEKWVINRQGTAANPIEIIGVSNAQGQQPIISGENAITPTNLDYWNERRGIIKIGGSSFPVDGLPAYIHIENLEIRSAQPDYQFTNDNGGTETYSNNAAAIYIEKAEHLVIKNCTLHDAGNGLFIGASDGATQDILIEGNYIYGNGIVGRFFEHNAYTECIDITYQYNRFGPLRAGAGGNNLKDRSAGLTVRYNWIEGGNRQLDLVEAQGSANLVNHPSYTTTFVYSNVLIEPDGAGNSQIIHYGGDSGITSDYRKGTLYLYNNTVISTRSGNTTLVRLSTADETAEIFNNIIYNTAFGQQMAIIDDDGTANLAHNWLKTDWRDCHCSPDGTVNDISNNMTGSDPLFVDAPQQDFALQANSPVINQAMALPSSVLPEHDVLLEYLKHQQSSPRTINGNLDMGAYELAMPLAIEEEVEEETEETVATKGLMVFPNPTTDFIQVRWGDKRIANIQLIDVHGKIVLDTSATSLDVRHLNKGLFLLRVVLENGRWRVGKVMRW